MIGLYLVRHNRFFLVSKHDKSNLVDSVLVRLEDKLESLKKKICIDCGKIFSFALVQFSIKK